MDQILKVTDQGTKTPVRKYEIQQDVINAPKKPVHNGSPLSQNISPTNQKSN